MGILDFLNGKLKSPSSAPQVPSAAETEQTLAEEAGLPSNWVPIEAGPIIPGVNHAPGAPPYSGTNLSSGPLPPSFGSQSPALRETGYGPGTGPIGLMPVGPSGVPQISAAIHSVASQVVKEAIAAIPPTVAATPVSDGLDHGTTPWAIDPTSAVWVDDFKYQTDAFAANGNSNETGWAVFSASGGAFAIENWSGGVFPHLGVMQLINSSTSNDWTAMCPANTMANTTAGLKETWPLLDYPGWKMSWVFQLLRGPNSGAGGEIVDSGNVFSLAKTSCYVGMATPGSQSPNNGLGPGRPWVFLGLRYDTDPGTSFAVTSVANASGGNTVYTGTFTGGGTNALINRYFTVTGFVTNPSNNGRFLCIANTTTTLTLVNASGVSESATASAKTDAISDSKLHFEYVTNPNGGFNNASPRNNTQGQTFNTGVTPTENSWYRLDMVCASTGVVTLTLSGGGSTLATWTVTCTTVSFGDSVGTSALAGVANGIAALEPADAYFAGSMMDSFWGVGSLLTVTSATPAFSGITGKQVCMGGASGLTSASKGVAFYTSASSFANTHGKLVVTGYPSFFPYVSFANDTSASPTSLTKSLNIDYFSFVWNPALSTAGANLNSGYSRYVVGS